MTATEKYDQSERSHRAMERCCTTNKANLGWVGGGGGWGMPWKVNSPSTLYAKSNDVELIRELILYCL